MTKEKQEPTQKMKFAIRILNCHVDGQGYVQKHFFDFFRLKVGTKNRISTCYTKNIDRILKCPDRLRSDFYKLVNLRLATFGFSNPGFTTLNLNIVFRNC